MSPNGSKAFLSASSVMSGSKSPTNIEEQAPAKEKKSNHYYFYILTKILLITMLKHIIFFLIAVLSNLFQLERLESLNTKFRESKTRTSLQKTGLTKVYGQGESKFFLEETGCELTNITIQRPIFKLFKSGAMVVGNLTFLTNHLKELLLRQKQTMH